jgi:hypothetical protein
VATMTARSASGGFLPIAISILALADGLVHLSLDVVLFRGRFFGSPFGAGPPGGARPPGPPPGGPGGPRIQPPLPLNELFLLNFVGYVILVLLFWIAPRWLGRSRWLLDAALMVYVVVVFLCWWIFGRPNPMGLGYLSKSIEILLFIALAVHARIVIGGRETAAVAT